jgi:hypothetical protein
MKSHTHIGYGFFAFGREKREERREKREERREKREERREKREERREKREERREKRRKMNKIKVTFQGNFLRDK